MEFYEQLYAYEFYYLDKKKIPRNSQTTKVHHSTSNNLNSNKLNQICNSVFNNVGSEVSLENYTKYI